MNEERRMAVLRAIVEDYVATREPVGSKALVERHQLGVSSATVRNDMAVLEEEGLIAQPHTSAGRIPTDAGYRVFVDRIHQMRPMTSAQRRAVAGFLTNAVGLDDIVDRTVRLLASLTRQVAVMQYPSLSRSTVRHVELVPVGASRLLVVLITGTGRVEQRVVDTPVMIDDAVLGEVRARINASSAGRLLSDASQSLQDLPELFPVADRPLIQAVVRTLDEAMVVEREERVVMAGTGNLTRFGPDFPKSVGPVLDALEEHVVLLRLLGELAAERQHQVGVLIGEEIDHEGLRSTAVVSAGYGRGSDLVGSVGVLGPIRMDYPATMAAVHAVARYVSKVLDE
ncbi:MAG: heat-inducible transcriptional repressor HrcA [Actinomycetota bacterium]